MDSTRIYRLLCAAFALTMIIVSAGCTREDVSRFTDLSVLQVEMPTGKNTSKIFAADGSKIADVYMQDRVFVPLKETPELVQEAFIAIEDERFFSHQGIDPRGFARAFVNMMRTRSFSQGASTITMQLARNLYLSREKTITRKTKEMLIAAELEKKYTKEEILEGYLNVIYFGHGAYGVKAAADLYFGKDLKELRVSEIATLAAVVKGPTYYSPFNNMELATRRRNTVLAKMRDLGFISEADYANSVNEAIRLADKKGAYENYTAPYFVDYVIHQLTDSEGEIHLTPEELISGGYTIVTTLDSRMQKAAESAVDNGVLAANLYLANPKNPRDREILYLAVNRDVNILGIRSEAGLSRYISGLADEYNATCVGASQASGDGLCSMLMRTIANVARYSFDGGRLRTSASRIALIDIVHAREVARSFAMVKQGAMVAVDPQTGGILAMVGGVDYSYSRYNRAWLSQRQVGSSFKPFAYITALMNGRSMNDTVSNSRYCVAGYCPKNYGGGYGDGSSVTYREALVRSLNIPAVRVGQEVGLGKIVDLCRDLGITSELEASAPLPLGTAAISPIQMAEAYGAIANGGKRLAPAAIVEIRNMSGDVIYSSKPEKGRRAIPVRDVRAIVPAMEDVIRRGTGTKAAIGRPAAGKTGTTNNYRDAWFVGFIPNVAAAVWIGNDDNAPLCSNLKCAGGLRVTGGQAPAPIWRDFMKHASAIKGFANFDFIDEDEQSQVPSTSEDETGFLDEATDTANAGQEQEMPVEEPAPVYEEPQQEVPGGEYW